MRKIALALAATTLLASSAYAQRVTNPTNQPPGKMMQKKGSVKGSPGASGYTPGHEMQAAGSRRGSPGASGYAPGQR